MAENKLKIAALLLLLPILLIGGGPFILGFGIVLTLGFCLMWASFPVILIILTILIIVFIVIPLITDFKSTIKKSFKTFKHKQAKLEGNLLTITTNDGNNTNTSSSKKTNPFKTKQLNKARPQRNMKQRNAQQRNTQQRNMKQSEEMKARQRDMMKRAARSHLMANKNSGF